MTDSAAAVQGILAGSSRVGSLARIEAQGDRLGAGSVAKHPEHVSEPPTAKAAAFAA